MSKAGTFPKIILNGKTYTAIKPKAKLWREIIKFNNTFTAKNLSTDENALDQTLKLISDAFKNQEVTPELIENELDLDELMPKFTEICEWVAKLVAGKSVELPNSPAPAKK
jgi:hypothetical protein